MWGSKDTPHYQPLRMQGDTLSWTQECTATGACSPAWTAPGLDAMFVALMKSPPLKS